MDNKYGLEIVVSPNTFTFQEDIYFVYHNSDGTKSIARPVELVFDKTEFNNMKIEPTLRVDSHTLQQLFDNMNKKGFKSSDKSFVEGELLATKTHLEDMRKLIFNGKS